MKKNTIKEWLVLFATIVFIAHSGVAFATVIDLTTAGSSGSDANGGNAVLFNQVDPQHTGTGNIDSFVQIGCGGNCPVSQAYNTTVNNVLNNGSSSQFNHAIELSQVPTVTISGITYREFVLDINQDDATPGHLLSLDDIQVFLTQTGNQSVNTFTGGQLDLANADLVYRMDASDDSIKLDASLNSGSGSGDMIMLIPDSLFSCHLTDCTSVVLYSHFGGDLGSDFNNTGGFEEWFVCVNKDTGAPQACTGSTSTTATQVPEPSAFLLLGSGLVLLSRTARRRFGRKNKT